jgi:hypothetical protein
VALLGEGGFGCLGQSVPGGRDLAAVVAVSGGNHVGQRQGSRQLDSILAVPTSSERVELLRGRILPALPWGVCPVGVSGWSR